MKTIRLLFFFLFSSFAISAQVYPVQVTTQLAPPFTPYLNDYTSPGSEKFVVHIRVTDPTLSDYTCKLRITIEGTNITIRTRPTFVAQPITLQGGGIPQQFIGEELAEYFNPNALDFMGNITRSQYEKGAKLPEGIYRFSVEVLDFNRGTVVSNKGSAMAWVILNDPPILNLPRNNSRVNIVDPTNIPFTWTPRHKGSPNAAFTTEYKFRMVEVWPLNRNPYDAFLSQPTLYETTTELTQIVYGMAEPALLPGRKYAWQVQAVDVEGRDLFKNQGRSEVFVFQYGEALGMPDGLYLQNAGPSLLNVRWEAPTNGLEPTGYRLQYRPHNNRKSDKWYETTAQDVLKTIDQLQPDTEYEVQVRAELNSQFSNYVPAQVFKTSSASSAEFACRSDVQPPPLPSNNTPAPKLKPNDVIHAGGYEVHVRKVTANAGGTYTGEGGAVVPYFMGAKVAVTFKDISVNEQLWLTAGEIKTVWNANSIFLQTIEKDVKSQEAADVGNTNVTMATAEELIVIEGTIIVSVTASKDGKDDIVISTSNGEQRSLPRGKSYAIVDAAGNGYVVDKEGNIAKTTAAEAQEAIARGNRTYATNALHFEKGAGKYGYDSKKYPALAQYYQQLEGGQFLDWKSVLASSTDPVDAVVDGNYDPKNIRFELNSSPVTPSATTGKKITLNVQGQVDGAEEELLAMYKAPGTDKDEVLGKLNVASYAQVSKNLVIVPVNTNKLPDGVTDVSLTKSLTDIYKQAVAEWKVSLAKPIEVSLDKEFNDGESGALTNYTDDMKKVINAYGKIQDNTYYIFLVSNPKSGNTFGYMPRSKQAGFVFVDKLNSSTIVNTIAHEIGHGAFNLQHTFTEITGLNQGTTDNLMDYNNNTGAALYKYQWDHIHSPQTVIGLFEDDADGKYETDGHYSTVYLVSLMLGIKADLAKKLAEATEAPDTYVHSEYQFEINDTWADGSKQKSTHSLTNGFHGTEELITALAFLYTPKENVNELGRLLHRYGDTYAHSRLDNMTPEQWDEITVYERMSTFIDVWMEYINKGIKENGLEFLRNQELQKKYLLGMNLSDYISKHYLLTPSDHFRMYGKLAIIPILSLEHFTVDGPKPDFIYVRPRWYLRYVNNLAELLATKYSIPFDGLDNSVFKKMVSFATNHKCSLKGIIDFEISKRLGRNYFFIPVFYSTQVVASIDAVFMTNYIQAAKDVRDNTLRYLEEVYNITKDDIVVKEITRPWYNPITNVNEISYLYGYQLTIKGK